MAYDRFEITHFDPSRNISVPDAVREARMDWQANKEPIFRLLADGSYQQIKSHRLVTRSDNGRQIGLTGARHESVQIDEACAQLQPLIDARLATVASVGALNHGSKVFVQVALTDGAVDVTPGDTIQSYATFVNAHDGSLAVCCGGTDTRIVCQNTMMMAAGDAAFKARHTKGVFQALDAYREQFAARRAALRDRAEKWRALTKRKLSDRNLERYIRETLQPGAGNDPEKVVRGVDRIVELAHTAPGATPGTLWGGVNAVTYWATHERGRTESTRAESMLLGAGGKLVGRALDVAYAYAEKLPLADAGYQAAQNFATAKADFAALLGRPARIPSELDG